MTRRRNAPLHGVRIVGSNMIEVDHGTAYILYSYETPVAVLPREGMGYHPVITSKQWSRTTSKHIGVWLREHGFEQGAKDPNVERVPQEEIEAIATRGFKERLLGGNPRRKKYYEYTESDIGSHIDGALGHGHAMQRMADLLGDVDSLRAQNLLAEYDDGELDEEGEGEWLDDATEALQEVTAPGLTWEWDAGDLVLTMDVEVER